MTPERWKTIEALYNELAGLAPTEQATRLEAVRDPEVAREVKSLLETSDVTDDAEASAESEVLVVESGGERGGKSVAGKAR